jgi:hypothetical protein
MMGHLLLSDANEESIKRYGIHTHSDDNYDFYEYSNLHYAITRRMDLNE